MDKTRKVKKHQVRLMLDLDAYKRWQIASTKIGLDPGAVLRRIVEKMSSEDIVSEYCETVTDDVVEELLRAQQATT